MFFLKNIHDYIPEHHSCQKIPRKKRKRCPRPMVHNSNRDSIQPELPGTWIFSRYSTGWLCGLHADWTELKDCVADKMNEVYGDRKRNLIYITNLRQPVQRFLSEWKHVQRGATWNGIYFIVLKLFFNFRFF